ncbi:MULTISPECIES: alanine racemase [Glycomyces]|uniref:Alanine racemase n=1 Tax=Glycomyces lechevalierae TaxID=256034 RepID=A0A9X3PKF4_9ACTN|nr:alanine racemase [Glycomyces lechevalierae]MDA1386472.1 alanine racemase [Glycomyces lechevalierae]MDR7338988.1 alanine racemase [Glycomyces lechevalierae]
MAIDNYRVLTEPEFGTMSGLAKASADWRRLAHNVETLAAVAGVPLLAMVKADAYGHGMVPAGRVAVEAGAASLGVVTLREAWRLKRLPDLADTTVMAFFFSPDQPGLAEVVDAGVELGVSSLAQLDAVAAAADKAGRPARIHLKGDTGMARGGVAAHEWEFAAEAAAKHQAAGSLVVVGAWSHMACADEIGHPANAEQKAAFGRFLEAVAASGLEPEVRHLANSAALISDPETRYDMVRPGIALYGYNPVPEFAIDLRPVIEVRSVVMSVKRVPAGSGISYGHTVHLERDTNVALVPLGYADGVPRAASGRAEVYLAGKRRRVLGRICMDQFMVDCGDDVVKPGEPVVLIGAGEQHPDADDWSAWAGTIPNDVLTAIGSRVPRLWNRGLEPRDSSHHDGA